MKLKDLPKEDKKKVIEEKQYSLEVLRCHKNNVVKMINSYFNGIMREIKDLHNDKEVKNK